MAFFTRPHFEDRQIVQYLNESITLSGFTYMSTDAQLITQPTYLNNLSDNGDGVFTGLTSGSTTISSLTGELVSGRVSGLQVQPPILNLLDISGNTTGTTTVDVTGYVLKAFNANGDAVWDTVASLSADTNTYLSGASLNCGSNILTLAMNNGTNYDVDLTCVIPTGTTKYVETLAFTANTTETITHNLGVDDELIISLIDTTTNEVIGGSVDNFQTNSFDVTLSTDYSSVKVIALAGGFGDINVSYTSFSGGSGNCITDLYVTNIHGCSPITINDTLNFNISGGTFFTDNNTNLDIGVTTDPINGDLFKIYFGTSYFGIRNTGSTNSVESVFLGNDSLGDILQVTTDGIVIEQEITSSIFDLGVVSGSIGIDIRDGNVQKITLSGNTTLNAFSAFTSSGGDLTLHLYQDGTGGHTLLKGTNILTEGGSAISITTGATTTDTLYFKTDDLGKYRLHKHSKDFS